MCETPKQRVRGVTKEVCRDRKDAFFVVRMEGRMSEGGKRKRNGEVNEVRENAS